MGPIGVTLLIIWLIGLGVGWIIGVYQATQIDYNASDSETIQLQKQHTVLCILGFIFWPIAGYMSLLIAQHTTFKKASE